MIALTGGSGMTGLHMKALLEYHQLEYIDINRSHWDLRRWQSVEQLDEIFVGVEAVIHFGAFVPSQASSAKLEVNSEVAQVFDANVRACLALADWATLRGIPMVFLSGSTVYQDPHKLAIKEDDEKVIMGFGGFYGYSKLIAENLFEHYRAQGLKIAILRASSIYGSHMSEDRLVANFMSLAHKGKELKVMKPVGNRVNLIHASDVALAVLTVLKKQVWGTFNIAGPENVSIYQIAKYCVSSAANGTIKVEENNDNLIPFIRFDLDCSKAFRDFGYKAKVHAKEGILEMAENKIIILKD